ncbi:MAG: MBL fold metallo-hydrolase [Deltaproteobacteria bacterium]|nr:MBL fold metallo-hydrolase [Deltaproteobacteria bacterium]MBW2363019.1 MBL fold metallo-hydrolase [Deltaproteobacteria bacterium]
MSNLEWKIGAVRVIRIEESVAPVPVAGLFPEATPAQLAPHRAWLQPHFADAEDNLLLSIHGLVVESQGRTILVDTCIGENPAPDIPMDMGDSPFLENLEAAGFTREAIDIVLCTHLHFDHVGWNTMHVDGKLVPTFPNARYLFARQEWEHWNAAPDRGFAATFRETVETIVDAGLADIVDWNHVLTDEVRLEPTPGHTPGHVAVHIASGGQRAMITGDLTHHPVQWAEPDWKMGADSDSAAAAATRRRLLGEHLDGDLLVIGTHYAPPTAGKLVSRGDRVRFDVD